MRSLSKSYCSTRNSVREPKDVARQCKVDASNFGVVVQSSDWLRSIIDTSGNTSGFLTKAASKQL